MVIGLIGRAGLAVTSRVEPDARDDRAPAPTRHQNMAERRVRDPTKTRKHAVLNHVQVRRASWFYSMTVQDV